jgi:hypothetical protein
MWKQMVFKLLEPFSGLSFIYSDNKSKRNTRKFGTMQKKSVSEREQDLLRPVSSIAVRVLWLLRL